MPAGLPYDILLWKLPWTVEWSQPASVVVEGKSETDPTDTHTGILRLLGDHAHYGAAEIPPTRHGASSLVRFLRPRRFVGIPVDHITVKFWSSDKSQEPKSKRLGALGIVDQSSTRVPIRDVYNSGQPT